MAWYPGAIRKEITKFRTPMRVTNRAFILHVAVSEAASLYGYFSGAAVCSHFYVRKDGTVEQYVDTRFQAPANYQANSSAYSVETQGGVNNPQGEPWTPQQVQALASLAQWLNKTHGVPLVTMPNSKPATRGIGYHRLGVNPWRVSGGEVWSTAYGKTCPGNAKIAQVPQIVRLASGSVLPVDPAPNPGTGGALKLGSSGPAVRELQTLLNAQNNAAIAVDGNFGPATQTAVRNYQASRGLTVDGLAGPATMAALRAGKPAISKPSPAPTPSNPVLMQGSTGEAVRTLQRTLNAKFPAYSRLVIDGSYGPAVKAVVQQFQRTHGLDPDGVYGPATRAALAKATAQPATPAKPSPAKLAVDGYLGPATIKRWQQVMGTPQDGVISDKSQLITKVQQHLIKKGYSVGKSGADGSLGPNTIRALQRYLGTTVDGKISKPSNMVKALQNRLNSGTF